ncbi:MAG: hypothetical protein RR293_05220 [Bacteroidales bacterium]
MKEESTPEMLLKKDEKSISPKESTIEFLKQFARVYIYNEKVPQKLGGYIAN